MISVLLFCLIVFLRISLMFIIIIIVTNDIAIFIYSFSFYGRSNPSLTNTVRRLDVICIILSSLN